MKYLITVILWLWQLPQNILGLLLKWLSNPVSHTFNLRGKRWTEASLNYTGWMDIRDKFHSGVSLGKYIFLCDHNINGDLTSERHEYGHTIQSIYLGPLYLLVVGLPSLIHAIWWKPEKGDYYDFFCERWADALGDVKRYGFLR